MDRYFLAGFGFQPAPQRPAAREHQGVRTLTVDHGKFDLGFKWSALDGLPHAGNLSHAADPTLIWLRCREPNSTYRTLLGGSVRP
jgi:hypothetical protein